MMPSLFVAHGSPMLALEENEYTRFLTSLAREIGRPRSIVIFSAHWEHPVEQIGSGTQNPTIHDFGGFPPALYQLAYPALGNPDLAEAIGRRLADAGFPSQPDPNRGLDHGAWVVLRLMYPEADIPVVGMSVNPRLAPEEQYRLGTALADLPGEDILIIGSGVSVHNFSALGPDDGVIDPRATAFDDWVDARVADWDLPALFAYRTRAPHADWAVPPQAAEHFVPLFYAMGAGQNQPKARRLHRSYRYRALSHAVWRFGGG